MVNVVFFVCLTSRIMNGNLRNISFFILSDLGRCYSSELLMQVYLFTAFVPSLTASVTCNPGIMGRLYFLG